MGENAYTGLTIIKRGCLFVADNIVSMRQIGNMMSVNGALVEEVSLLHTGGSIGFLVVSSAGALSVGRLRLNVSRNTVILGDRGRPMCLCDIRRGMRVDALFSPVFTRSLPPQSAAFLIVVRREAQPADFVTTDRVIRVDPANRLLLTGNPRNVNNQIRFVVTDDTVILDRNGRRIQLRALRPGQTVRVTHANFQTPSIPPQTTAFVIQVL